MIVLGVILLICGLVFHVSVLWTIGVILVIIGVILMLVGTVGNRQVGGRRHWY